MPPFLLPKDAMMEITADIKRALDKAKIALMLKADTIFFTTVLFSLKLLWDATVKTAATDGTKLFINPEFFMSLDAEERLFLLIHETLHAAFMHMLRLGDRDPKKWNIACDHYINLLLIARGFKMPKNGLADKQYIGLNPDQIYKLLPDDPTVEVEVDILPPTDDIEDVEKQMEDILVRASIQSKMAGESAGAIPNEIEIFLNKLLNPKLPWQRILQKFIRNLAKNDYSFKKPNRRYFPEHYLPSAFSQKVIDMAIAVDASGSVTDNEFLTFVSEITGLMKMMKPNKITLIQFDSRIKHTNEIKSLRELSKVKFHGRGGTRIEPVIDWANKHKPQLLLVFSDGQFNFYGDGTKIPVVWLINNNPNFTAPYGKTIHYDI